MICWLDWSRCTTKWCIQKNIYQTRRASNSPRLLARFAWARPRFKHKIVGYGLGKANRLGKRGILNTELTLSHVNELENWTTQLNLLGQFKLTFDYRVSKRLSFYAGPTLNAIWSDLYDPFSGRYGSIISRDDLWNTQTDSTNFQGWIGFTAGVRIW